MKTSYGQVVVGPPGSGKTTYCAAMHDFLTQLGRKVVVVNLDPANDYLPYPCKINISDFITVKQVMDNEKLGPNGSILYCVEKLSKEITWLKSKLAEHLSSYFLFDCPGQVELYTHHKAMKNIMNELQAMDFRICAMNLVDSYYCSEPYLFISVVLMSLSVMIQLELPHLNVFSKVDLIELRGQLDFNIDFYTEVLDLQRLLERLSDDEILKNYKKLNKALCSLIEDYSLVSFSAVNIQDKESMAFILAQVDKATGYIFGSRDKSDVKSLMSYAFNNDVQYANTITVIEKYLKSDDEPHMSDFSID